MKALHLAALLLAANLAMAGTAQAQFGNLLRQLVPQLPIGNAGSPGNVPSQARNALQLPAQLPNFSGTTLEQELAIGRQLAGNLLGAVPLVRNAPLQHYVNRVGRWIASQSERPELTWYFAVLDSDTLNAFALPGGYVFITRGLYARLASEAELAGVLGHEIGHVVMKHHLKVLEQSKVVSLLGSVVSSQVSTSNSLGNSVAQNLLGSGAEAIARGLDKDAEHEADRVGVVLATRAGYEAYGLPVVLEKLARVSAADSSISLLFKTHPAPLDRLQKLGDAMKDSFDKYAGGKTLDTRFAASLR